MVAVLLYQRWIKTVRSDAEGRFAMPMFPGDLTEFTVVIEQGGRKSPPWQLRLETFVIERVLR